MRSRGSPALGQDGERAAQGEDEAADPQPRDHAVDLELHRGLRAVARKVAQDQVHVLHEAEPVVDGGDGRLLLGVELARGWSMARRAAGRWSW